MTTLFHAAPIPLESGSIILPGNWGRILRLHGAHHNAWRREIELERWRMEHHPTKPSRLDATFACPDEVGIRAFVKQSDGPIPRLIYEVEAVDPVAAQHVGDWGGVNPLPEETYAESSERYWTASCWLSVNGLPNVKCVEVVLSSPLRIMRRLD